MNFVIRDNDNMEHVPSMKSACKLFTNLYRLTMIVYFYINNNINTCIYTAYEQAVRGYDCSNPYLSNYL
jgi:hypothetical protein